MLWYFTGSSYSGNWGLFQRLGASYRSYAGPPVANIMPFEGYQGAYMILWHIFGTPKQSSTVSIGIGTPIAYMGICGTYMGICETYLGILHRCEKPGTFNSMVLYDIAYFELYLYFCISFWRDRRYLSWI